MISASDKARRQCASLDAGHMIKNLPDLAESLHNAAIDLSRDCTLDRVDLMLIRIKGAENSLVHLRKALATEGDPPDGQI